MSDGTAAVKTTDSLRRVLESIQTGGHGLCVVTDFDDRIVGTITDGDCRRALLGGKTLDSPASEAMHTKFIAVDQSFTIEQIRTVMHSHDIRQVPVVDDSRRLVRIVSDRTYRGDRAELPNAALILAGGKGTRLRPLTESVPKPLLPVGGKPMLEHLIVQLVHAGVRTIYVSINYLGHLIEEYFGDGSRWGCTITYLAEEQELGTGGPLRLLDGLVDEPVIVLNGDLVTTVDFKALLDTHRRAGNAITIAVTQHENQIPFGVVSTTPDGTVSRIEEKPVQRVPINAGIYVVEPRLIPLVPAGVAVPMTTFLETALDRSERVGAFMIHEVWNDVGLPIAYMKAQKLFGR